MKKFANIYQRAEERKGGKAGLQHWIPDTLTPAQIANIGDDRFLSEMTRCIFQAGFVWRVINNKWSQFEEAFWGFEPQKMVMLSPDHIDRLAKDERIVRNRQKIMSVPHNAQMILDVQKTHGSYAQFVASWPEDDLVNLFLWQKKQGQRLGGMTGQRLLRNMGKDTFILTADVARCLIEAGVETKETPSSQRELKAIQQAFNTWQQESGLGYTAMSRICACSVGENYPAQ